MGLQTRLTDEYGLDVPLVSAGMALVARAPLAAAVSAAGGLGVLGATATPADVLAREIAAVRSLTDRTFGVNFIARFSTDDAIAAAASAKVPVVTFFWDEPSADWIATLKEAGTRVWFQVGSPDEAVGAIEAGADALVVQGFEAGGHNRSVASTMSLVPVIADAVSVPIIAAGGIADGRGLAAALVLGASGALMGTRFVMSSEADAAGEYQRRVMSADVGSTARHNVFGVDFPNATVRGLRNSIVEAYLGHDEPAPYLDLDPATLPIVGTTILFGHEISLTRFNGLPPLRATSGDFDQMSLLAGETVGLIHDVRPAQDIIRDVTQQAERLLSDGKWQSERS